MGKHKDIICVGAGPAGLTAAYLLAKEGHAVTVLEADPRYVGGLSRTEEYKGYCFDIGGHRFFSKSSYVEDLWSEILPNDLFERPRSSQIYYRGKTFSYPLRPLEALTKLGPIEALRCLVSYLRTRWSPIRQPSTFEAWVTNQFGARLYEIFFKTYTEKVWGIPCNEISADWAAQRIQGLSLKTAILDATGLRRKQHGTIKTLISSFRYPRRGPGMLWEAARDSIVGQGARVLLDRRVVGLAFDATAAQWEVSCRSDDGEVHRYTASDVICSAPLRETVHCLTPPPARSVWDAATALAYRDFLVVVLILKERNRIRDNWIYIHEPCVQVGRIQNFKAWSADMVPNAATCCYGMEYFCFEDDALWRTTDEELLALGRHELQTLGLADHNDFVDGTIVRQRKAYPLYDGAYQEHVARIRAAVEADYPGLHLVGRNGMHKYNNQDHAMMTAKLTVDNIVGGAAHDVWLVNQDAEYHESGTVTKSGDRGAVELRGVPERVQG